MDNNSASPNGLIVTGIVLIIIGIIGLANLANETRGTVIIGSFVCPVVGIYMLILGLKRKFAK